MEHHTGRRFDTGTGLYYYRAHYYDPCIGRFLQTDPIGYGDGMNLYRCCGNNPVYCLDSFGLSSDPAEECVLFYDAGSDSWCRLASKWDTTGMAGEFHCDEKDILGHDWQVGNDTLWIYTADSYDPWASDPGTGERGELFLLDDREYRELIDAVLMDWCAHYDYDIIPRATWQHQTYFS
jgi:RHS repeat-associated protein